MDPTAPLEIIVSLTPALSVAGSSASILALYMAVRAFAKSRKFRNYVDKEDRHNVQALETVLRGCSITISRMLRKKGDEQQYFRSLNALLAILPGALTEYGPYIRQDVRRRVLDTELALLDASTNGYARSRFLLKGAQNHVRAILGGLDLPPDESRPQA